MLLPDHVIEFGWPQTIRKRPRRASFHPRSFE
jgi:hypothetical protein